ncbi:unnamed protein product [Meloidogyne enterolobii]|uniref:Uncharacterized protein n=1 Tax=Meloidogyne enterolobii TaxID=390850 RepID=A0ACB0ZX96_MELEN
MATRFPFLAVIITRGFINKINTYTVNAQIITRGNYCLDLAVEEVINREELR